jgi:hypothetical protein
MHEMMHNYVSAHFEMIYNTVRCSATSGPANNVNVASASGNAIESGVGELVAATVVGWEAVNCDERKMECCNPSKTSVNAFSGNDTIGVVDDLVPVDVDVEVGGDESEGVSRAYNEPISAPGTSRDGKVDGGRNANGNRRATTVWPSLDLK